MRSCRKCRLEKPFEAFGFVRPGVWRATCGSCRRVEDARRNPERVRQERERTAARAKEARRAGLNVARWVLEDSRKSDRKRGLANDLAREWVEPLLSQPCSYCGETTLRMTLDRIDNALGHLRSNVVPACIRCNYARRAMPHKAWLCLVPGLRAAREQGLFGDWTGRCR